MGRKADFEQFYESEAPGVYSAVYSLCRDPSLAEDATQEGFARALERWDRLGSEPWAGGWVMTTALNIARRGLRHRPPIPAAAHPANPDEGVDLWARVRTLSRRQQQVVVLYYRLGMPVEEIARVLSMREGTVRTHLARARRARGAALGEAPDGD